MLDLGALDPHSGIEARHEGVSEGRPPRRRALHPVAQTGEPARDLLGGGRDLRVGADARRHRPRRPGDPPRARVTRGGERERLLRIRQLPTIRRERAGDGVQEHGVIGGRPRQPAQRDQAEPVIGQRRRTDPATAGLEFDHAGARGRDADRSATVRPQPDGRDPGGERHRGAAGRPTGRAADVPRVARHPERHRLGERELAELRHRRCPDHHRPRRPQPADHLAVRLRRSGVAAPAERRDEARDVELGLATAELRRAGRRARDRRRRWRAPRSTPPAVESRRNSCMPPAPPPLAPAPLRRPLQPTRSWRAGRRRSRRRTSARAGSCPRA